MKRIFCKNLAQIREGTVEIGDLTLLVGPQATGKSIFLQTLKLILDGPEVAARLKRYGYDWVEDSEATTQANFLRLFYGKGMEQVWNSTTEIKVEGKAQSFAPLINPAPPRKPELSYIPAQRVLSLRNGFPLPFSDWNNFDPYVVRYFSDKLREKLEIRSGIGGDGQMFPGNISLKTPIEARINNSIFHQAKLELVTEDSRRQLILSVNNAQLPFLSWSAGQREFVPLMLELYNLLPVDPFKKKPSTNFIVLEEPEMGLHPKAIESLILLILDLIARGYKVLLSSHSPVFLEAAWAIRHIQKSGADQKVKLLEELFETEKDAFLDKLFRDILQKDFRTYYFCPEKEGSVIKDISGLDPGSDDSMVSDWGGLSSFSTRVNEVVAKAVTS